jgi:hypothetical protein
MRKLGGNMVDKSVDKRAISPWISGVFPFDIP